MHEKFKISRKLFIITCAYVYKLCDYNDDTVAVQGFQAFKLHLLHLFTCRRQKQRHSQAKPSSQGF